MNTEKDDKKLTETEQPNPENETPVTTLDDDGDTGPNPPTPPPNPPNPTKP